MSASGSSSSAAQQQELLRQSGSSRAHCVETRWSDPSLAKASNQDPGSSTHYRASPFHQVICTSVFFAFRSCFLVLSFPRPACVNSSSSKRGRGTLLGSTLISPDMELLPKYHHPQPLHHLLRGMTGCSPPRASNGSRRRLLGLSSQQRPQSTAPAQ